MPSHRSWHLSPDRVQRTRRAGLASAVLVWHRDSPTLDPTAPRHRVLVL